MRRLPDGYDDVLVGLRNRYWDALPHSPQNTRSGSHDRRVAQQARWAKLLLFAAHRRRSRGALKSARRAVAKLERMTSHSHPADDLTEAWFNKGKAQSSFLERQQAEAERQQRWLNEVARKDDEERALIRKANRENRRSLAEDSPQVPAAE